jgi:leucyl aminopeptidase
MIDLKPFDNINCISNHSKIVVIIEHGYHNASLIPIEILNKINAQSIDKPIYFYESINTICGIVVFPKLNANDCAKNSQKLGREIASLLDDINMDGVVLDSDLQSNALHHITMGFLKRAYVFETYKTRKQSNLKSMYVNGLTSFMTSSWHGIFTSLELASLPANILTPKNFANHIQNLEALGLDITILDVNDLTNHGMNLIIGAGQGSSNPPYVAIMEWKPNNDKPIVLVGKGVCFDGGGTCVKSTDTQLWMKGDKSAAASVVGTMESIARMKLDVHVVGIVGLIENKTDGNAIQPGDILKSHYGHHVEIINTDAEGRLVLADCLSYATHHYSPQYAITMGTLTPETFGALGRQYGGLFSENSSLTQKLNDSSIQSGDELWHLPMDFKDDIQSKVADIKNLGVEGWGESGAAAAFLNAFCDDSIPFAHIDSAGMAWHETDSTHYRAGMTGYGVELLIQFISQFIKN